MAEDSVDEHFVEVISNVSHANGVFRVTFAQQEADAAVRPITRLLIPANQLGRILNGLNNAAGEIGQKVRQQVSQAGGSGSAARGTGARTPATPARTKQPAAKAASKASAKRGKSSKKKK